MTTFVLMYHPQLDNRQAEVPLQSVDDHASRGWLLVDGSTPTPSSPFLTPTAGDARYLRADDVDDPGTPTGGALRAASVAVVDTEDFTPVGAWDWTGADVTGLSGGGDLSALGLYFVDDYGADPTGATDSTDAIQAALAAMPTTVVNNGTTSKTYPVGVLRFGAGLYRLGTTEDVGNIGPFVSAVGPGKNACRIDYRGAGAALRAWNEIDPRTSSNTFDVMFDQSAPHGLGSIFDGFTVDGTNSLAGAIGLHVGDYEGGILGPDLFIQHFNKAGSQGIWFENKTAWLENWRATKVNLRDCTTHVRMTGSSLSYNDLEFKIWAQPDQDGVVVDGGGFYYHGSLRIRGNFGIAPTTNSGRCLRIQGSGSGAFSGIAGSHLDIQVECNRLETSPGGTGAPQTIWFEDVTKHKIYDCTGILHFSGNTFWQYSNWTKSLTSHFGFDGVIVGDRVLNPTYNNSGALGQVSGVTSRHRVQPKGYYDAATTSIDLTSGDFFDLGTLTANTTLVFANALVDSPRRIRIRTQQGSNRINVTWPTNLGTVTYGNPHVIWENGVPPLMNPTTNAVDLFELWTLDGRVWHGTQLPTFANPPTVPTATRLAGGNATSVSTQQQLAPGVVPVGDTLVQFCANTTAGNAAVPTVTDTLGHTWTVDQQVGTTGAKIWVARTTLTTATDANTRVNINWSATTSTSIDLVRLTGLGATPILDRTASGDTGSTAATKVTAAVSAATAANAEIGIAYVAAATVNASNPTWTVAGPPGSLANWFAPIGGSAPVKYAQQTIPAAGSMPFTTWTASAAFPLAASLLIYRAA